MSNEQKLTPAMQQYMQIRRKLADDIILLYRMGDFYEMFYDDAKRAAPILNVALTERADAPLCGIPYHALDSYLAKIIRAGKKAAICEQMCDPKLCKGIVPREVVRIVTPGTIIEDSLLTSNANNFLASVSENEKGTLGLAFLDISTGDFTVEKHTSLQTLTESLLQTNPSEAIIPTQNAHLHDELKAISIPTITTVDDWTFSKDAAYEELLRLFGVSSLDGYGLENSPILISAAGSLIHYIRDELKRTVTHIRKISIRNPKDTLTIDESTSLNLDITPERGKPKETTLLGVLDTTKTPMGARLLRTYLLRPSANFPEISSRHEAVEWFTQNRQSLNEFRYALSTVRDIERLITRIGSPQATARDLRALATSLSAIPALKRSILEATIPLIKENFNTLSPLPDLTNLLTCAITETPPISVRDGGIITQGYNKELDELRSISHEGTAWIAQFQAQEQQRTGIKTLRVHYNKIFGYYIEISKGQASQAPADYERRQTLVNAERFITPELKEYESKILGADERAKELEYKLFTELKEKTISYTQTIQQIASAIATLDVISTFAERALSLNYIRPTMHERGDLQIVDGRHPIIESLPTSDRFVPNNTLLDTNSCRIAIITGPNMAGKSTYIRQVAIIAIMAHAGSFVPAKSAQIPILDRVFSRVGAGDELAKGRSTFMVEMQETANILNSATNKSLIILDEIGRGTSTFDGISIAWAVAEHIDEQIKAKTLFATHYHELTRLSLSHNGIQNFSVAVRETQNGIVFLRKIKEGPADKSYGIHVAKLAGLPQDVVDRANEILQNLEKDKQDATKELNKVRKQKTTQTNENQPLLFNLDI